MRRQIFSQHRLFLSLFLGLPADYTDVRKKKLNFIEVRDDIRAREVAVKFHNFQTAKILM